MWAKSAWSPGVALRSQLAVKDFGKAIDLIPNDADPYFLRALAYGKLNKFQKSIKDLDRVIEINPYFSDAFGLRSYAYGELGHEDKAQSDKDKTCLFDSKNCWQS